jgi:hypothetical protein
VKLYVGITDYDWFKLHSSKESVEEVNFWRPSSQAAFRALEWGEPFLFKLHAPRNFIVGGGFFTKFLRLPVSLAWETFGEANGAQSLAEVRVRIAKYRKQAILPTEDPVIGCILLEEPFFFEERDWIPTPVDQRSNTSGKELRHGEWDRLDALAGSYSAAHTSEDQEPRPGNRRRPRKFPLRETTASCAPTWPGLFQGSGHRRLSIPLRHD